MTIHESVSEQTLETLRKLMAHESSAREIGSIDEATAFSEKIQELLIKHKLEAADIPTSAQQPIDLEVAQQYVEDPESKIKSSRIAWEERLALSVADAHFCKILVKPHSNMIWMVGTAKDREVASFMFVTLRRMIRTTSLKKYSEYFDRCQAEGHVEDARGFRASWINAAVSEISKRFYETRQRANQSSAGTSIVLANADALVKNYMQRFTHNAGVVRGQSSRNLDGAAAGREWGQNVSLDSNGVSSGSKRGAIR